MDEMLKNSVTLFEQQKMLKNLLKSIYRATKVYKESYSKEEERIKSDLEDFRAIRKATETQRLKAHSLLFSP